MYRREEFLAHYHKRSNVESAFSMIKRSLAIRSGANPRRSRSMRRWQRCSVTTSWCSFTRCTRLGLIRRFGRLNPASHVAGTAVNDPVNKLSNSAVIVAAVVPPVQAQELADVIKTKRRLGATEITQD